MSEGVQGRWVSSLRVGAIILVLLALGLWAVWYGYGRHWFGELPSAGTIAGKRLPPEVILARQQVQTEAAERLGVAAPKQILFGDFHVHTTYSTDAFLAALPIFGGQGYHPIGEACDYARYCSSLDFWAITDHAESSTPRKWRETKDSVRQCQALCGEDQPDLISFIGFEWTQVGRQPDDHYGHKNVIFRDLEDSAVSTRPISAAGLSRGLLASAGPNFPLGAAVLAWPDQQPIIDFNASIQEIAEVPACDANLPSNQLPEDCHESAATPGEVVRRLEEQGLSPLLIPHGSTWGFYTPQGVSWDKQLKADMRPDAYSVIEVMSGHGNSEEYRPWRAARFDSVTGRFVCPSSSGDYLPSCQRAGEIIEARCLAAGLDGAECKRRAADARDHYANMGAAGHLAIQGEAAREWLDAGQCKDCFLPSLNYRPGGSVQYGLAISDFSDGSPKRFNWGFIAASDNHRARPGTGYKPVSRLLDTEAAGAISEDWDRRVNPERFAAPTLESTFLDREALRSYSGLQALELERQASFFTTGGLAAVHAETRTREGIWDAFQRREIYGTSGPRILLWFDLLNAREGQMAMGSTVSQTRNPTFEVRAMGAFRQLDGCPAFTEQGLDAGRIERLCSGECYNPSEERHRITHIQIIRIRPQAYEGEPVERLIEDPWLEHECPASTEGCSFRFSDDEYRRMGRDVTYYARAIQEPTATINADGIRCGFDASGNCTDAQICHGNYRTPRDDNCLAPAAHRAWSSPIYLHHPRSQGRAMRPSQESDTIAVSP